MDFWNNYITTMSFWFITEFTVLTFEILRLLLGKGYGIETKNLPIIIQCRQSFEISDKCIFAGVLGVKNEQLTYVKNLNEG